jgi:hypothetical protein
MFHVKRCQTELVREPLHALGRGLARWLAVHGSEVDLRSMAARTTASQCALRWPRLE